MKIECTGNIGVCSTKLVPYWYKRNGYYVGRRYVKPKRIKKFKRVKIKEPFLVGNIELGVDMDLFLGGIYVDENGQKYLCVRKSHIDKAYSWLRILQTNLGSFFSIPQSLTLLGKNITEY